jgi:hypothetical protein
MEQHFFTRGMGTQVESFPGMSGRESFELGNCTTVDVALRIFETYCFNDTNRSFHQTFLHIIELSVILFGEILNEPQK